MALTATEQELFDIAKATLPSWYTNDERANEFMGQAAKQMGAAIDAAKYWFDRSLITGAGGATGTEPDWLNQHARDRGTARQKNESDAALRKRLRIPETAVTRRALLSAAQQLISIYASAYGAFTAPGTADMVELPRDQIFLLDAMVQAVGTTGGTFTGPVSGKMTFVPTDPFPFAPYHQSTVATGLSTEVGEPSIKVISGRIVEYRIVITSAANAGNNGTYTINGLAGNGVTFNNGAGVAAVDGACSWAIERVNGDAEVIDERPLCYISPALVEASEDRADRIGRSRGSTIILILPHHANATARDALLRSVREMVRVKKAAGVISVVEIRTV